jgi:plasmid maintenance system killer protein
LGTFFTKVHKPHELRIPLGNRLEALGGNKEAEFSVRINEQYSICFKWQKSDPVQPYDWQNFLMLLLIFS